MLIGKFQLYNENVPEDEPFEKEFSNNDEFNNWMREQIGHPFLSIQCISLFEKSAKEV